MFICVSDKPHYAMLENIFVYNAVTYCFGCISFKVKSFCPIHHKAVKTSQCICLFKNHNSRGK